MIRIFRLEGGMRLGRLKRSKHATNRVPVSPKEGSGAVVRPPPAGDAVSNSVRNQSFALSSRLEVRMHPLVHERPLALLQIRGSIVGGFVGHSSGEQIKSQICAVFPSTVAEGAGFELAYVRHPANKYGERYCPSASAEAHGDTT